MQPLHIGISKRITKILSISSPIGIFIVNTMGFIDTDTGSALGCGRQWPLCNNQVIPSTWDIHTIIEYAHRGIVGVVSLLLIALSVFAWIIYGRYVEVRALSLISIGFVFIEALLGALGVVFGDPPTELATHFGVSLIAFSAVLLLYIVIRQIDRRQASNRVAHTATLRPISVTKSYGKSVWFAISYLYVAMYIGAYVANSGTADHFRGLVLPTELRLAPHGAWWIDSLHRTIAVGLLIVVIHLVSQSYVIRKSRPDLWRGSLLTLAFTLLQLAAGVLLIASHISLLAQMIHTAVVTALFGTMCYMALQALPEPHSRLKSAEHLILEH